MYLNQARAKDLMERNNLDGLVVTSRTNLLYVTDFLNSGVEIEGIGILPRSPNIPPTLIIGHKSVPPLATNSTWIKNILTFEQTAYAGLFPHPGDSYESFMPTSPAIEAELHRILKEGRKTPANNPLEALAYGLRELGLDKARLGFDELEMGEVLQERHLPELRTRGARDLLLQVRLVKTPEEVNQLRRAAEVNQDALQEALRVPAEGVDVADVATAFRLALVKRGAVPAAHGGFLTGSGERGLAARYHHVLKKGDVLFGGAVSSYNSYYSDFLRTYVVGRPTTRQAAAHSLLEASFDQLETLRKPSINSSEIGKSIAQTITREGGDVNQLGLNIHSMGLDIVEIAHHRFQDGFMLEPNVCFDVYALYKEPVGGDVFSIEHNYIVTDDGWEPLDTMPHHLIEVA